ncbi:hypothetical protein HHK36_015633 [Tetracentron sinense]|uniref:F-box domain-containing protein n=1 Tax=Tetracentron sinense TaxID=13715 RepID=A0A835DDU8_TETSI|nr:hypothetical protein HHK36_015633 [Tetracentron sinense]
MHQKTWPIPSEGSHFTALPLANSPSKNKRQQPELHTRRYSSNFPTTWSANRNGNGLGSRSSYSHDFSMLPFDVVAKIGATFSFPNLRAASMVCRSWRDALRALREAMLFLRWGKRFKHGRGGVRPNLHKALDSFLKGAARGSSLAMVDAGLLYWEMGNKDEGIAFYMKAALLGDPAGQCNLGISYLQAPLLLVVGIRTCRSTELPVISTPLLNAYGIKMFAADTPNPKEAVKWLFQASTAGHVRAQYQLALCLHQGRGVECNLTEAAKWYLKAAEGGYVRAMYNTSLCYSFGEGLVHSHRQAKKWMKRAADRGHSKAQFEHGLGLFSQGEMLKAVVYLELATRAGETAATHVKNVILPQLSATSRDRAMVLADSWRALSSR